MVFLDKYSKVLGFMLLLTLLAIAWTASLPSGYRMDSLDTDIQHTYYWSYVGLFLVTACFTFLLLKPWGSRPPIFKPLLAFMLLLATGIYFTIYSMHSPPVHSYFAIACFVWSQIALTIFGFGLGRKNRSNNSDV